MPTTQSNHGDPSKATVKFVKLGNVSASFSAPISPIWFSPSPSTLARPTHAASSSAKHNMICRHADVHSQCFPCHDLRQRQRLAQRTGIGKYTEDKMILPNVRFMCEEESDVGLRHHNSFHHACMKILKPMVHTPRQCTETHLSLFMSQQ